MIVYDFDGVMTDNRALISASGEEFVYVNRSDGLGISYFKQKNIKQIILSSEKNNVVQARATKLGIECTNGVEDKKEWLIDYCKINSIDLDRVIFVGNDINDLEIMKIVGLPVCPSDAYHEIQVVAKISLVSNGGYGVVREMINNKEIVNFLKLR